jgi:hypothetical protein
MKLYLCKWVGWYGPVLWQRKPSSLIPLDYYMWGSIYNPFSPQTLELKRHTQSGIISVMSGILEKVLYKFDCCMIHIENL